MKKQKNKNRKANRLWGFDYSASSYYFVTVCIETPGFCFSRIVDN